MFILDIGKATAFFAVFFTKIRPFIHNQNLWVYVKSLSENIVGTRTSNRLFNNVFDFFLLKIKFTANIVLLKELKREIQIAKLLFHGQNQLVLLIREIIRNQKKLSSEQDTVESDFAVPWQHRVRHSREHAIS